MHLPSGEQSQHTVTNVNTSTCKVKIAAHVTGCLTSICHSALCSLRSVSCGVNSYALNEMHDTVQGRTCLKSTAWFHLHATPLGSCNLLSSFCSSELPIDWSLHGILFQTQSQMLIIFCIVNILNLGCRDNTTSVRLPAALRSCLAHEKLKPSSSRTIKALHERM